MNSSINIKEPNLNIKINSNFCIQYTGNDTISSRLFRSYKLGKLVKSKLILSAKL